jgi:phosphate:Na+ symporter
MKNNIEKSLKQMAEIILEMTGLVYKGLMENDAHFLDSALNKERILDDFEKDITAAVIEASKGLSKKDIQEQICLEQTAQNIERMGDELRSLMERIELKIAERLYFSDIGIKQYVEVFEKMQRSVSLAAEFLTKDDKKALDAIIRNGNEIKVLVEKYRVQHLERLAKGICEPRAANMFFDMLDFTGNIARHCTNIAKTYKG